MLSPSWCFFVDASPHCSPDILALAGLAVPYNATAAPLTTFADASSQLCRSAAAPAPAVLLAVAGSAVRVNYNATLITEDAATGALLFTDCNPTPLTVGGYTGGQLHVGDGTNGTDVRPTTNDTTTAPACSYARSQYEAGTLSDATAGALSFRFAAKPLTRGAKSGAPTANYVPLVTLTGAAGTNSLAILSGNVYGTDGGLHIVATIGGEQVGHARAACAHAGLRACCSFARCLRAARPLPCGSSKRCRDRPVDEVAQQMRCIARTTQPPVQRPGRASIAAWLLQYMHDAAHVPSVVASIE